MANDESDSDGEYDLFGLGPGVASLSTTEEVVTSDSSSSTLLALERSVISHHRVDRTQPGLPHASILDTVDLLAEGEYLKVIEAR